MKVYSPDEVAKVTNEEELQVIGIAIVAGVFFVWISLFFLLGIGQAFLLTGVGLLTLVLLYIMRVRKRLAKESHELPPTE